MLRIKHFLLFSGYWFSWKEKAKKKDGRNGKYLLKGAQAFGATGVGRVPAALLEVPHRGGGRRVPEPGGDVERRRAAQRADLVNPNPAEAQDGVAARVRLREVHVLAHQRRLQRVHALLRVVRDHRQLLPRRWRRRRSHLQGVPVHRVSQALSYYRAPHDRCVKASEQRRDFFGVRARI